MDISINVLNEKCLPSDIVKASSDEVIQVKQTYLVPIGFSVEVPDEYIMDIRATDDMINKDISILGYTIGPKDFDYEVGLIIYNFGNRSYYIEEGDIVGNINFIKKEKFNFKEH